MTGAMGGDMMERGDFDSLSATVHELRAPLTIIRSLAEQLRDVPGLDADQRDRMLGIIAEEAARMGRLVEALLADAADPHGASTLQDATPLAAATQPGTGNAARIGAAVGAGGDTGASAAASGGHDARDAAAMAGDNAASSGLGSGAAPTAVAHLRADPTAHPSALQAPARVDLRALTVRAVETAAPLLGAAVVKTDLAAVPLVRGKADEVMQILMNLLSNAAKFAPATAGRIAVTLTAAPDHACLTVTDNGPGIPPDQAEAVFQPFHRLGDPTARPPGTGLGLPIARRIAQHYGGGLAVESVAAEGGARFVLRLPLAREDTP